MIKSLWINWFLEFGGKKVVNCKFKPKNKHKKHWKDKKTLKSDEIRSFSRIGFLF